MTERFPDVEKNIIGELLVVGVLYDRGMITHEETPSE
jgi:hypothetical protein